MMMLFATFDSGVCSSMTSRAAVTQRSSKDEQIARLRLAVIDQSDLAGILIPRHPPRDGPAALPSSSAFAAIRSSMRRSGW
jgi:hypothetical protein